MATTALHIFSQTSEFDRWAYATEVKPEEALVLERYLDPDRSVLEGGTAGGRLLQFLQARGFQTLAGFDFVPGMIDVARRRDTSGKIDFRIQEATALDYSDGTFEQAVYLQQILSGLDSDMSRRRALRELRRVLIRGGVALISFLGFEARSRSLHTSVFLTYLKFLRAVTFSQRGPQQWPMLKVGNRFRLRCLWDASPYMYWFRISEVQELLNSEGFDIFAAGVDHELDRGIIRSGCGELAELGVDGTIYVACRSRP